MLRGTPEGATMMAKAHPYVFALLVSFIGGGDSHARAAQPVHGDRCDTDCGVTNGPCDVAGCGLSEDCNENNVPDQRDPDFDGDGTIDDCDDDIDDDGVLYETDVCDFTPAGVTVDSDGRPLGDIDKDCDTDLADYGLFQQGFTGPGS